VNEVNSDAGTLQMAEFLEAVRTRQPPPNSIEDAHFSTTTVKLAMIAYAVGCKITWDGANEQIVGNPAAAALLKREYRTPWQHPWRG
jgi:hypothetical protein